MHTFRPVTFFLLLSLFALFVANAISAPAASNPSVHAEPSPRLLSLLHVTVQLNAAFQAAPAASKEDDPLPDGKGKDMTKKVCSGCHALSVIVQQRHSAEEWDSILERMLAKGLEASDDDLEVIHNYLVTTLGTAANGSAGTPPATPTPQ